LDSSDYDIFYYSIKGSMTTEEINTEIKEYIKYSLDFADQLLIEYGEYFPFASQINNDGKLTGVGFKDDDDKPLSQALIDLMTKHLDNELSQNIIRSYCIVFDVRVKNNNFPDGIDAIVVSVKHTDNFIKCFYPYLIDPNKKIKYFDAWSEK
jgi:hypothetical protein